MINHQQQIHNFEKSISEALKENTTLKAIESNTLICFAIQWMNKLFQNLWKVHDPFDTEAFKFLAEALKENTTLEELNMGLKPKIFFEKEIKKIKK